MARRDGVWYSGGDGIVAWQEMFVGDRAYIATEDDDGELMVVSYPWDGDYETLVDTMSSGGGIDTKYYASLDDAERAILGGGTRGINGLAGLQAALGFGTVSIPRLPWTQRDERGARRLKRTMAAERGPSARQTRVVLNALPKRIDTDSYRIEVRYSVADDLIRAEVFPDLPYAVPATLTWQISHELGTAQRALESIDGDRDVRALLESQGFAEDGGEL